MPDASATTHRAEDGKSDRRETITLYKYMSLAGQRLEYAEDLLEHNRIFLSRPDGFNDPFDCQYKPVFNATREERVGRFARVLLKSEPGLLEREARERAAQHLKEMGPEGLRNWEQDGKQWEEASRQSRSMFRINCLSDVHDSVAMWSHYADGHKGICVGFRAVQVSDRSAGFLCDSAGSVSAQGTLPSRDALPVWKVHYEDSFPKMNLYTMDIDREMLFGPLITKSPEWAYEKEWRVIAGADKTKRELPTGCIACVILGSRTLKVLRKGIADLVRQHQPDAKLYQATIRPDSYALDIVPV